MPSAIDNAEFVLTTWHDIFRCDLEYRYRHERSSLVTGYLTWYPNERWGFDIFGRYEFETSQVEEVGGWIQYSWDCFALRLIGCSDPSVTVESVKLAEDGTGDLVIRLYESMGGSRTAILHPFLPFHAVRVCSLDEHPGESLPVKDGTFTLSFRPFEIVTLRLSRPD